MTAPMQDLLVQDDTEDRARQGTALCLSGGGYRAMTFHAGVLQRLNESGVLSRLDFVSSVSGGSITAGVLALAWPELRFEDGRAVNLDELVVDRVRQMARRDLDVRSVLGGLLRPRRSIADQVAAAYAEHLFGDATLQDLPDEPRFVFCATNLQTAALVRFSKKYVADHQLGIARRLPVPLAAVVGASSAFPPYLSPVTLRMPADAWDPDPRYRQKLAEGIRDPLTLTDGGVYDNLGLEPVIKRCREILVSDGGGYVGHPQRIPADWVRGLRRVSGVIDHQVRNLRKRMLVAGYKQGDFSGAYWSIRSDPARYPVPDRVPFDEVRAKELAAVPTRLAELADGDVEDLLGWGSAICDTALRSWVTSAQATVPEG
jgi:NTE family protein